MNIIIFTHPSFSPYQSIHRFTKMLAEGMVARRHNIEILAPDHHHFNFPFPRKIKKWAGYFYQYILFPIQVRKRLKKYAPDTLFVFADHALGPWIPLVKDRPHVIHCHDFLAQRAAIKEIPEKRTKWLGRRYQSFIRKGYSKGRYFISVSERTREDLHRFMPALPTSSEVVYNGLSQSFILVEPNKARLLLSEKTGLPVIEGYLLHVGGNQWYKNRSGVIEMYNAWRSKATKKFSLLMIGDKPDAILWKHYQSSPFKTDIHFLNGADDQIVSYAYSGAILLLFPSIAEGFGWPIAEAMASGCPVITTNEPPMTVVAGDAGFFIPRIPVDRTKVVDWTFEAARVIDIIIDLTPAERKALINAGLQNAKRFDANVALDKIEATYRKVLQSDLQE